MGEPALRSHASSKRHKSLISMSSHTTVVADFLSHTSTAKTTAQSSASIPGDHDADAGLETSTADQNSASTSGDHDVTTERKISFATTAETLAAEVLWALKVTTSHYSHHSCDEIGVTFRTMFPDSRIAAKFSCGSNKCSYLVRFGLAPYFKGLLLKRVKESGDIVVMLDESLNTVTKR